MFPTFKSDGMHISGHSYLKSSYPMPFNFPGVIELFFSQKSKMKLYEFQKDMFDRLLEINEQNRKKYIELAQREYELKQKADEAGVILTPEHEDFEHIEQEKIKIGMEFLELLKEFADTLTHMQYCTILKEVGIHLGDCE